MAAPLFFGLYGNDDEGGEQDENQNIMSEGLLKPIFWTRQLILNLINVLRLCYVLMETQLRFFKRGSSGWKGPLESFCNTHLHTTYALILVWAANNLSFWFKLPGISWDIFPLVFPLSFWPVSGHMWGLASELKS